MIQHNDLGIESSQKDGQVHISITGKESQAMRSILHGQGFRWTNSTRTWFRVATPDGQIALRNVVKMLDNLSNN